MTKRERVRYEALLRVRDFGNAHADLFPESSLGGQAFAKVTQATAQIDAHVVAKPLAAADGQHSKAVARAAVTEAMQAIANTARGLVETAPKRDRKLRMPKRTADVAVLQAGRRFVGEAEAVRDQLLALGLPPAWLTKLREATDDLEAAMQKRRSGREAVSAAQKGIAAALTLASSALRTLDIVVPNTIAHDPVLVGAWERDRRVVEGRPKHDTVTPTRTAEAPAPADATNAALPKAS